MGFIKRFINQAAPSSGRQRGSFKELYKMEDFYRKEGGARKLLAKEKDCPLQGHFPLGGRTGGLLYR